jgi:signal transduction histidine kinase
VTEGIGLGLSIAKWIIDEHQGSVEVVTRQGEGTTFVIWLPVSFSAPLE